MNFGLVLLPLVGGFLFLTRFRGTRYGVRREGTYWLLFTSASGGFGLLGACFATEAVVRLWLVELRRPEALVAVLDEILRLAPVAFVHDELRRHHPAPLFFSSLALGYVLAIGLNLFVRRERSVLRSHRSLYHYRVVLPLATIVSASRFDLQLHRKFQLRAAGTDAQVPQGVGLA